MTIPVLTAVRTLNVEVWSDIACPWCYIGKRRFATALADFPHRDHVEVTWRSYELSPSTPVGPGGPRSRRAGRAQGHPARPRQADVRAGHRRGRRGRPGLRLRPGARRQHVRGAPPGAPRAARRAAPSWPSARSRRCSRRTSSTAPTWATTRPSCGIVSERRARRRTAARAALAGDDGADAVRADDGRGARARRDRRAVLRRRPPHRRLRRPARRRVHAAARGRLARGEPAADAGRPRTPTRRPASTTRARSDPAPGRRVRPGRRSPGSTTTPCPRSTRSAWTG